MVLIAEFYDFSKLLTGGETCVHMFQTQRRTDNKQWKQQISSTSMVDIYVLPRNDQYEEVLYTTFFTSGGPVTHGPWARRF